jgi:hypothetical protein
LFLVLNTLSALVACDGDSSETPVSPQLHSFAGSEWSEPVNVGAPVNSPATEQAGTLSRDGLSLYFTSNRQPGGFGGNDIWVSQRACADCPWQTPVNLGAVINSAAAEGGANLSNDGQLLFFNSSRPGGAGSNDIYLARRVDPQDDFGWGPPELLGSDVNTAAFEAGAHYLQSAEDGPANLYFSRGPSGNLQEIYYAPVTRNGETLGPAVLVQELTDPATHEAVPTVRADGREVFFWSGRPGGPGGGDLWTSTRRSVHEAWTPPENLGTAVNSPSLDFQPSLSFDARTLVFASNRPGSISGSLDIWMSTRTPSGR